MTTDLEALRRELTQGWSLPQVLRLAEVVKVTGLSYESIRYHLDSGALPFVQSRPGTMRRVPIEAVLRFCNELGILPAWETLE